MDGQTLKSMLETTGLTITEIARRVGMSQQAFFQSLNAKDIKTGLLEKLCEALGVDMSFFYPQAYTAKVVNIAHAEDSAISGTGTATTTNAASEAMVQALLEQNRQLLDMLSKKI